MHPRSLQREQIKMARRLDKQTRHMMTVHRYVGWRVRLARWLLRSTSYDVYHAPSLAQVERIALAIQDYAQTSGHLTRVYTVGQRVQSFARNLLYFMAASRFVVPAVGDTNVR